MKTIGQYKEMYYNTDVSVVDHISPQPHPNKKELLAYLNSFDPYAAMPMIATDEVDGKTIIGTIGAYNDGKFAWRSPLLYYLDKYNLELPDEFVAHVLQQ